MDDRISELPESILHQIISLLPTRDAARACMLSKKWNDICYSSPILNFDEETLYKADWYRTSGDEKKCIQLVDQSIIRRQKKFNGLNIDKFRLYINFAGDFISFVDRWIWFAVKSNVKELSLHLGSNTCVSKSRTDDEALPYRLHPTMLQSKYISVLRLGDCELEKSCSILLPRLKTLSLVCIENLNDQLLSNIFSGCPLVKKLSIKRCNALEIVEVSSTEVKFVKLQGCRNLRKVLIQAPNLESFNFSKQLSTKEIDIASCVALKSLLFKDLKFMTDYMLEDIVWQVPSLQNLEVANCTLLKNVAISCSNLKNLVLYECSNLVEVELNTPNLLTLVYTGNRMSFVSISPLFLLEAKILLKLLSYSREDFELILRNFLAYFNECKGLKLTWWGSYQMSSIWS